jgi:peptidoglycan/xylan/chitin deacetylase (PgdA/CDA1 family)
MAPTRPFFVIGDHARGNASLLERIRRKGNEPGNHLDHEYPSVRLSQAKFEAELRVVDEIIRPMFGPKWFRPGSGWFNSRMLADARRQGYRCALGSVYPFDPCLKNDRLITWYIRTEVFPGAVIILHDGREDRIRSVRVLQEVLTHLAKRGFNVVTLSELVARQSRG